MPETRRIKRGWMNLVVRQAIRETHDTKTLILEDREDGGRPFDFTAGQYLTFRFDTLAEKPVVRSYTMSGAPSDGDFIAVTVKEVQQGFVSRYLCRDVQPGDTLRARGPIGRFCYRPEQDLNSLSMVAAGSGVTPFISIMKEYQHCLGTQGAPEQMTLLVSYRSLHDLICKEALEQLSQVPGIRVLISLSQEAEHPGEPFLQGRISAAMLDEVFGDYQNQTFMTCGPQGLMDLVRDQVLAHGVDAGQMRSESFDN
ncbi:MAG: hypothetical protein H6618_08890 [Deltaproteobacteria bacterium]|nr:hypothetical protein [Deltaproteobacteria bacterium]